jgi:hypothetical protein
MKKRIRKPRALPTDRQLARFDNLLKLPLVEVTWADAMSINSWSDVKSVREAELPECRTIGRLLRLDRRCCAVAPTVNITGEVGSVWVIPRPWVSKIKRLGG